jgi:L-propargylglycine--L-glutamate ligase
MAYGSVVVRRQPFLQYAAERGFSQVGVLRDPAARVVLITPEPVDADIANYYLRDLAGFRGDELPDVHRRFHLLSPSTDDSLPLDERVLADEDLLTRLREFAAAGGGARLVNFAASPATDALSVALGIPAEQSPHLVSARCGGKRGGKEILRRSGVPTPAGLHDNVHSLAEVLEACRRLGDGVHPARLVAVKLDDAKWGAAVGMTVLDREKTLATGDPEQCVVRGQQPWPAFLAAVEGEGAIVEQYLDNVVSSPSGQAFIDEAGVVHMVSTQDQLLEGDRYLGFVLPAPEEFVDEITQHVMAVGDALARLGIRGMFGIDFIALSDGTLLAVEINLRKVGPSHVVAHLGDVVGSGPTPVSVHPGVHVVHRRVHEVSVLAALTPIDVVHTLGSRGLLFDHTTGVGVLLHMLGAVSTSGYVETTSVAWSREHALALDHELREALNLPPASVEAQQAPVLL